MKNASITGRERGIITRKPLTRVLKQITNQVRQQGAYRQTQGAV